MRFNRLLRWPRLVVSIMHRSGVRPSVCPILFNLIRARCVLFLMLIWRAAHTQLDSPGGSMRRDQHTFWPDNKEDRHTCVDVRKGLCEVESTAF